MHVMRIREVPSIVLNRPGFVTHLQQIPAKARVFAILGYPNVNLSYPRDNRLRDYEKISVN